MMMTSRKYTQRSGWRARALSSLAPALLLFLTLVALLMWRGFFSGLLLSAMAPVRSLQAVWYGSEVVALKAALASSTALLADREILYAENLELKKRLNRDASVAVILAGVVLRPPGVPYDTLVVDAGAREGVAVGDMVAAGGTVLIGRVFEVYGTTSRVRLFSAPGEVYDALLKTADRAVPVQVEGQGSGSLTTQVPVGVSVAVGDAIVFPDSTGGYASVVSAVVAEDGASFKKIYARLPVDPLELTFVEIWKH
jgi:cell shape-determining protein MreC